MGNKAFGHELDEDSFGWVGRKDQDKGRTRYISNQPIGNRFEISSFAWFMSTCGGEERPRKKGPEFDQHDTNPSRQQEGQFKKRSMGSKTPTISQTHHEILQKQWRPRMLLDSRLYHPTRSKTYIRKKVLYSNRSLPAPNNFFLHSTADSGDKLESMGGFQLQDKWFWDTNTYIATFFPRFFFKKKFDTIDPLSHIILEDNHWRGVFLKEYIHIYIFFFCVGLF